MIPDYNDGHSPDCDGGKGYVSVGACSCGAVLHECKSCSRVASKGQSWGFGLCQCGDFRAQPDDPKQHDQPTQGKGADREQK